VWPPPASTTAEPATQWPLTAVNSREGVTISSPTSTTPNSDTPCTKAAEGIAATLEKLEAQAECAHILTEDLDAAVEAELNAQVMVLERALKAVAPVRRAICGPIESEDVSWVGTSRESSVTYFPQRGLRLAGGSRMAGDYDDTRGAYKGSALVLWADGTLGQLEYSGEWTKWMREANRLESIAIPITTREALQQWNLEDLLASLTAALNEQAQRAGTAEKERAIARAARLAAVAALAR
jgi:hypothetical protein